MIASTRLQKTPREASSMLRLAETYRRRGNLEAARRAYRRSISIFLACGFEIKARAVKRALDGLRPPPPSLAERVLLVIAWAWLAGAARFAAAAARARAWAAARRSTARPALAPRAASAASATAD